MSTRHRSRLASLLLTGLALAAATGPACAQDEEPAPVEAAPPAATDAAAAERLLQRLEALHPLIATRPAPIDRSLLGDPESAAEERKRFAFEMREWKSRLERIPEIAQDYREAAGEAAVPKAWFFSGFALVRRADTVGRAQSQELLGQGVRDLRAYLDAAAPDAAYRLDAQRAFAYAGLRLAAGDGGAIAAVAPDVDAAVRGLLAEGRGDEAGSLAFLVLKGLVDADRESDAAALAAGWDAGSADFGRSTDGVRRLVRRSRVRPGAPMPELPAMPSYTGEPMPWGTLSGKPYVLHFFSTVVSDTPREIETILVPLHEKWKDAGLRLVGCSMDRELSDEEIARTRKNHEEWGRKEPVRDGRKASVREWAEARGVDWPWTWDGKWINNELVQHLGVEVNAPFAILVDGEGTIVWRGQPFEGLDAAVEKLMAR